PSEVERRANIQIDIKINLENVVTHPALNALFTKLPKNKTGSDNFKEWGEKLISNFKKKAKSEVAWYFISINIKNGILYQNGKVELMDTIHDQIRLSYEISEVDSLNSSDIEKAITLRIVVVNGSLNLEIGCFSKEFSPEIYKDGFLAKYQHYQK